MPCLVVCIIYFSAFQSVPPIYARHIHPQTPSSCLHSKWSQPQTPSSRPPLRTRHKPLLMTPFGPRCEVLYP